MGEGEGFQMESSEEEGYSRCPCEWGEENCYQSARLCESREDDRSAWDDLRSRKGNLTGNLTGEGEGFQMGCPEEESCS